jgi:hypothetical protein
MSRKYTTMVSALLLVAALTGCGGGSAGSTATPAVATDFGAVVPASTMTWSTTNAQALQVHVTTSTGAPAGGAAVRIFSASMVSPQDGSALEEAVPVDLLDTIVTDSAGVATLTAQLPAHLTDVLVVATWQDEHVSRRVVLSAAAAGVAMATAQ